MTEQPKGTEGRAERARELAQKINAAWRLHVDTGTFGPPSDELIAREIEAYSRRGEGADDHLRRFLAAHGDTLLPNRAPCDCAGCNLARAALASSQPLVPPAVACPTCGSRDPKQFGELCVSTFDDKAEKMIERKSDPFHYNVAEVAPEPTSQCPTCRSNDRSVHGIVVVEVTGGSGRVNLHNNRFPCADPWHGSLSGAEKSAPKPPIQPIPRVGHSHQSADCGLGCPEFLGGSLSGSPSRKNDAYLNDPETWRGIGDIPTGREPALWEQKAQTGASSGAQDTTPSLRNEPVGAVEERTREIAEWLRDECDYRKSRNGVAQDLLAKYGLTAQGKKGSGSWRNEMLGDDSPKVGD